MPAHFTHIYTARRVADLLASGAFEDWPQGFELRYDQAFCAKVMHDWEKFTAIGAIGPDLFYFSQDYNTEPVGQRSDVLMLTLAAYFYFDAAKEDDWEPLLIILQEVNATMAALLRFLIQLEKIWKKFVEAWDATIGPLVSAATSVLDDLTGGLISEFGVAVNELTVALKTVAEEEILTFQDIFGAFDTCVSKGWSENAFLWSDMSHYRGTSRMCQNLVKQAERLRDSTDDPEENERRFQQFLAFALGYTTHVGTDTIAHSFVNEQCGGPFRNHPQRHHLIESHIDAWNYKQTGPGGNIPADPWGANDTYPELSMSALHYAVQMKPDNPYGEQRPAALPADAKGRKKALDVDGRLPDWMCDAIVLAMMETFANEDHPMIFGGQDFQDMINHGLLTEAVKTATGHGLDQPFNDLLQGIAPKPDFDVPVPAGFPLPWQIQTMYQTMMFYYKFTFEGSWELQKPRKPDFVIVPPWSDVENLFQPPDFSGVDSSNPAVDVCEAIIALVEWGIKELGAAATLAGDLVKMAASPGSYLLRLGLYDLSMMVWDVITKTHEVLAHTGFMTPHGEVTFPDGELRLPNEIDLPLITLGGTVDGAFQQALAAALDPRANLDKDSSLFGSGHQLPDPRYPYYPVLKYVAQPDGTRSYEAWEFRRPWAYPNKSRLVISGAPPQLPTTPTERRDASQPPPIPEPDGGFPGLIPGPYPAGTTPDMVFFRSSNVDPEVRRAYEGSPNPAATDELNAEHLFGRLPHSPLGDPVPFSAYLIGRLANPTGYTAQFNLDSDRAYAYLTWDWVRGAGTDTSETGKPYHKPLAAPANAKDWKQDAERMQLKYIDGRQQPPRDPR